MATTAPPVTTPDPTTPAPATPIKPGWQTSEAWITFLIVALGGLLSSGLVADLSAWGKVISFAIAALKATTYTVARSSVKRAAIPQARVVSDARSSVAAAVTTAATLAIFFVAISQIGACASAPVHAMTGAFSACTKADLGQVVNDAGQDLEQSVASLVKGNVADLETQLASLAVKVGLDALTCAIAAVEAALATPPVVAAGSGVSATAAQPSYPGLARAKAWLEAQRAQRSAAQKGMR